MKKSRLAAFMIACMFTLAACGVDAPANDSILTVAGDNVIVNLSNRGVTDTQLAKMVASEEIPTNVITLSLGSNEISDLTPLSGLTDLRGLLLEYNQISDISPLSELINLVVLNLNGNQVSDLTPLSNHINLATLVLYQNPISDFAPLKGLPSLASLSISIDNLTDDHVNDLQNALPNIRNIFVSDQWPFAYEWQGSREDLVTLPNS
jgi:hypothetical protein